MESGLAGVGACVRCECVFERCANVCVRQIFFRNPDVFIKIYIVGNMFMTGCRRIVDLFFMNITALYNVLLGPNESWYIMYGEGRFGFYTLLRHTMLSHTHTHTQRERTSSAIQPPHKIRIDLYLWYEELFCAFFLSRSFSYPTSPQHPSPLSIPIVALRICASPFTFFSWLSLFHFVFDVRYKYVCLFCSAWIRNGNIPITIIRNENSFNERQLMFSFS